MGNVIARIGRGGEVESIRRRCENLRERRHDGDGESGLARISRRESDVDSRPGGQEEKEKKVNSRGERQSAKEGGKKMDYRRRKKIQLKTPEVIPGGVTVRKGKKGKR